LVRLARWAAALLVMCCISPSIARASCGDYLHRAQAAQHEPPLLPHSGETPTDPSKPCSGPNCSGAPVVPPMPTPTVAPSAPTDCGCLAADALLLITDFRDSLCECIPRLFAQHPSAIFHPPRLSA